jgi:hypothetical protein
MYSRGTADALIRRTNDEKPLQKTVYHAAGRNDPPKEHKYPIADRSNIRISDY